ncbi:MAG: alpha/beta hydrolase [Flavitalea sp.]
MRYFISLVLLFVLSAQTHAQQGKLYLNKIFEETARKKNISYSDDPVKTSKSQLLDVYLPLKDTNTLRPLIILMHGGGFRFGSKNISRMKIWGKFFAERGYVVAAINYRKSKKHPLNNFEDLAEACADAMEDASMALKYLRQNYKDFGIDTGKVIMGGHSAGGMIALQSAYSTREEIMRMIRRESASQKPAVSHNSNRLLAVINYWGAIYDTAWLKNARVPIVSAHGSKDRVVPYNFKEAPIYGSGAIHRVADRIGIINDLKTFDGKGHELQAHFNPVYAGPIARKRWRQAADFTVEFLYSKVLALNQ